VLVDSAFLTQRLRAHTDLCFNAPSIAFSCLPVIYASAAPQDVLQTQGCSSLSSRTGSYTLPPPFCYHVPAHFSDLPPTGQDQLPALPGHLSGLVLWSFLIPELSRTRRARLSACPFPIFGSLSFAVKHLVQNRRNSSAATRSLFRVSKLGSPFAPPRFFPATFLRLIEKRRLRGALFRSSRSVRFSGRRAALER